jgi:hypothetical protein
MVIDLDIPEPTASLTTAPATISGTALGHFDRVCGKGSGTAAATLVLTRK